MLAAMGERSFVVTIAYIKTEPIQVAVFGLVFLGDVVTWPMMVAIVVATAGVVIMSTKPRRHGRRRQADADRPCFRRHVRRCRRSAFAAASSVCEMANYVMAATFTLAVGIAMQAVLLSVYLGLRGPVGAGAILRAWKPSLLAGLQGAVASQFWFLGLCARPAPQACARLALMEVLFAQLIARFAFGQHTTLREAVGMVLVVAGVGLLLWAY